MATEIERKFLVTGTPWKTHAPTHYCQGYLNRDQHRTVRVRIAGDQGWFTVKSLASGMTRLEFEYEIPVDDAQQMLKLCEPSLIEKFRYVVPYAGMQWEIDEFHGENEGLVVAEIELASETQSFEMPDWVGEEVTHDPRYYNANLSLIPYQRWNDTQRDVSPRRAT